MDSLQTLHCPSWLPSHSRSDQEHQAFLNNFHPKRGVNHNTEAVGSALIVSLLARSEKHPVASKCRSDRMNRPKFKMIPFILLLPAEIMLMM